MKRALRNSLLLTGVIAAVCALPSTWFVTENLRLPRPGGAFDEMMTNMENVLEGLPVPISGTDGQIEYLGGFPYWGIVVVAIGACSVQLLANSHLFLIPLSISWALALGAVALAIAAVVSVYVNEEDSTIRIGWVLCLYSGSVAVFCLTQRELIDAETMAKSGSRRHC